MAELEPQRRTERPVGGRTTTKHSEGENPEPPLAVRVSRTNSHHNRAAFLKPVRRFANPDFGHDGSGWRRTSTQPRCWILKDQTRYLTADSVDPVVELLLEDGQVVGISKAIRVPTTLRDVFAVSEMPPVLDYWPGTPYVESRTLAKARQLLAKLIVQYERKQAAAG